MHVVLGSFLRGEVLAPRDRRGVSTNQLMTEHHLAKRTISALLKANASPCAAKVSPISRLEKQPPTTPPVTHSPGSPLASVASPPRPLPERFTRGALFFVRIPVRRDLLRSASTRSVAILISPLAKRSRSGSSCRALRTWIERTLVRNTRLTFDLFLNTGLRIPTPAPQETQ